MRSSQHVLEHYFGYIGAICFLLVSGYSSGVAAQHPSSEITLDNVDDTRELRSLYASGEPSPRASISLDSGELVYLELSYIQPFATDRQVLLDGKPIDPSQYETARRYYRGSVAGDPESYAFLSVAPSGESSLYIDYAGNEYNGTILEQGSLLTLGQKASAAARAAAWSTKRTPYKCPGLSRPQAPRNHSW